MRKRKAKSNPVKVERSIMRSFRLPRETVEAAERLVDKLSMRDVNGAGTVIIRRAMVYGLNAFNRDLDLAREAKQIEEEVQ